MHKLNFGGIIVPRDVRDYDLSKLGSAVQIPEVFMPDYSEQPIENQAKHPACGSHAGSNLLNILKRVEGKPTRLSPRYLWKKIKDIDGFPVEAGTDVYSILKTLKNGVCTIDLAPNETDLSLQDYRNLKVTNEMEESASKNKLEAYATNYSPTFQQIKQAIYLNKAVLILMRVGKNMYRPSWKEKDILPLSPNRYPMDSGHFMLATGYDEKRIYGFNEWSENWGKEGMFYFEEDYMYWVNVIATGISKKDITPEILPPFTRNLTLGYGGQDVKNLQIYLNSKGFLVAESGAGSKGKETTYFGTLTKNALARFQLANNINPASGFFGRITRKWITDNASV